MKKVRCRTPQKSSVVWTYKSEQLSSCEIYKHVQNTFLLRCAVEETMYSFPATIKKHFNGSWCVYNPWNALIDEGVGIGSKQVVLSLTCCQISDVASCAPPILFARYTFLWVAHKYTLPAFRLPRVLEIERYAQTRLTLWRINLTDSKRVHYKYLYRLV